MRTLKAKPQPSGSHQAVAIESVAFQRFAKAMRALVAVAKSEKTLVRGHHLGVFNGPALD